MKPIPAQSNQDENSPPSASDLIKSTPTGYATGNRRSAQAKVNRAYPLLLVISTAVAVFFAFMYINKPVVVADHKSGEENTQQSGESTVEAGKATGLLPPTDSLPGEGRSSTPKGTPRNLTTAPIHSLFEETNMRVQHILTAKSDDGHVSRIDLEVPVLYQSRQLRWTATEVNEANQLMLRLMDYQDKSRQLSAQGERLLIDWNALIGKSIPASKLRADSPSIPENQQAMAVVSGPTAADSDDAVEIDPKEEKP